MATGIRRPLRHRGSSNLLIAVVTVVSLSGLRSCYKLTNYAADTAPDLRRAATADYAFTGFQRPIGVDSGKVEAFPIDDGYPGADSSERIEPPKMSYVVQIRKKDGRVVEREMGPLSRGLAAEAEDLYALNKQKTQLEQEPPPISLEELETFTLNGSTYNISAMAEEMMKRRGIDPDKIPEDILEHPALQEPEPLTWDWRKPSNQWKWFKMKNYEYWEEREIKDRKEREMIKSGEWLRRLQREDPWAFRHYVQVGEQPMHIKDIAKKPSLHQNVTFLRYLREQSSSNFKILMKMKNQNKTVERKPLPIPELDPTYINWRGNLSYKHLKALRRMENVDFLRSIRVLKESRRKDKKLALNPNTKAIHVKKKHKARYPRPWREPGMGRIEKPYLPKISWEHRMAMKRMRKEHQMQRQNERQRRKEFRELEARRRLARRRQRAEAADRAAIKERLGGSKIKAKIARMSKKERRALKIEEKPDNEDYFKL